MRVLVLGGDGYLGWPTAVHLSDCGHTVGIADNFARRNYDHELGVESLVPVHPLRVRVAAWAELSGRQIDAFCGDITDAAFTRMLDTSPVVRRQQRQERAQRRDTEKASL